MREALNEIMSRALKEYDEGKDGYKQFIEELSKPYTNGKALIKLRDPGDIIDSEKIIQEMLSHGFRPDGIAYLLIILGEVLSSGHLKIDGFTPTSLRSKALDVWAGVLNATLEVEAKKIDEKISHLRNGFFFNTKLNNNYIP